MHTVPTPWEIWSNLSHWSSDVAGSFVSSHSCSNKDGKRRSASPHTGRGDADMHRLVLCSPLLSNVGGCRLWHFSSCRKWWHQPAAVLARLSGHTMHLSDHLRPAKFYLESRVCCNHVVASIGWLSMADWRYRLVYESNVMQTCCVDHLKRFSLLWLPFHSRGIEKFVFFPLQGNGSINLHRQICVETCPTSSGTVMTHLKPGGSFRRLGTLLQAIPMGQTGQMETNSLLTAPGNVPTPEVKTANVHMETSMTTMSPPPLPAAELTTAETVAPFLSTPAVPATTIFVTEMPVVEIPMFDSDNVEGAKTAEPDEVEEVAFQGYPTFPVAGVLCMPDRGSKEVSDLLSSNPALQFALQVSDLWHNKEVLIVAALTSIILALAFLCVMENCAIMLTNLMVFALIIIPALFGSLLLYKEQFGVPEAAEAVGAGSYLGAISGHNALWLGVGALSVSCVFLACACYQCGTCKDGARAVEEAAECLMTMPSLLLEPIISFLLKVPVCIAGSVVFLMLVTSGDKSISVDLTNPESLFHPDSLASISAVYFLFAWLVVLEVLHYISAFIAIYVAEVWFFKHFQQRKRGGICEMCGPKLLMKGLAAAMRHLGSLIYAAVLMAVLRPIRWVMKAFLSAEEAASYNDTGACILAVLKCVVESCFECIQHLGLQKCQLKTFCFGTILGIRWIMQDRYLKRQGKRLCKMHFPSPLWSSL